MVTLSKATVPIKHTNIYRGIDVSFSDYTVDYASLNELRMLELLFD